MQSVIQLTGKRLAVLEASLAKKEALFNGKLSAHFQDVAAANGQPLNDKANGSRTAQRWEQQNNSLRTLKESIERTRRAIEQEKAALARVADQEIPDFIMARVESGELSQWRKFPNTFFVAGVDRARLVWNEKNQVINHRYVNEITDKDQYKIFARVFNELAAEVRAHHEAVK